MIAGVTATADDGAVVTNGMTTVVELTDEVIVDGPTQISGVSIMAWYVSPKWHLGIKECWVPAHINQVGRQPHGGLSLV